VGAWGGILLAAWIAWAGGGCVARRAGEGLLDLGAPDTAQSLYQALLERDAGRWSLGGTAKVRVDTGERKARLDVTVVCERPGRLRFDANDFLDHLLFLAVVRDGVLATYSVPENLYARGHATPERIGELLGVPLSPESVVSMLLGAPFFVPLANPVLRLGSADGRDHLSACTPLGDLCTTVQVDRQGRPLESLLEDRRGGTGEGIRVRVTFSRYREADSDEFPFRIQVLDERTGRSFRVDLHEIELNREWPSDVFSFGPPAGAGEVVW